MNRLSAPGGADDPARDPARDPASDAVRDAERRAALAALQLLDTGPEPVFDQIVALAATLCGTALAAFTLIDGSRYWLKARLGFPLAEVPRGAAICDHVPGPDGLFEVPDAQEHAQLRGHPHVVGAPHLRFYASAPVVLPEGGVWLGNLCVADAAPRRLDDRQREALSGLAALLVTTLVARRARLAVDAELHTVQRHYALVVQGQSELVSLADEDGRLIFVNDAYARCFGRAPQAMVGTSLYDYIVASDRDEVRAHLQRVMQVGQGAMSANRMRDAAGDERWIAWSNRRMPGLAPGSVALHSVGRDVTDEMRARTTLAQREAHHRQLYEATPALLHTIDPAGRLLAVSDQWLRRFGYRRDEVLGRPSTDFMAPESAARERHQVLPAFFRDGLCQDVPYRMLRRDGRPVDVLLSAVLERDAAGAPLRSLAVLQDVTERRAVEATLAAQEQKLQLLVDGVRDHAIYMLDTEGHVATWNVGAERHKGYAADEVLGRHYGVFFTPEEAQAGQPQLALRRAAQEGRHEAEGWRVRRNGQRYWAGVSVSALRGPQGQLLGYAKITRDLTEQRRQQRMLQQLVELAPYAMLRVGPHGAIDLANAQAETTFGYGRSALMGLPLVWLLPDLLAWPAAGRVERHEMRARDARGREFPVEAGLSVLESDEGPSLLVATLDITERRRQQAATEQALADKETLLKEVYHRVKNNLQVVQSLLNLQRQSLADTAARDALDDSVQRVRAMALVHERLYQSGTLSAIALPEYVRELVAQIVEAHRRERQAWDVSLRIAPIETRLDSAVPFGLLLTELVTNALKHAPRPVEGHGHGGHVDGGSRAGRLEIELQPDGPARVRLRVRDDGAGFPSDAAGARVGGSASMGLRLAERLARQLGGQLLLHNDAGAVAEAVLTRL